MSPDRYIRGKNLIDFVREELARFEHGEISRVSSTEDLRRQFGYTSRGAVREQLKSKDLLEEVKSAIRVSKEVKLPPSREVAWMLGFLSGCGDAQRYTLRAAGSDYETMEKVKAIGEEIFHMNATVRQVKTLKMGNQRLNVEFNSVHVTRAVGSLKSNEWPQTIIIKHEWVLHNEAFLWSFLEGYFETRGSLSLKPKRIAFNTSYPNDANFITDILTRLNIHSPVIFHSVATKRSIAAVGITNLQDLKQFSDHVSSVIPRKQEILDIFKSLDTSRASVRNASDSDIVTEWLRIASAVGHIPTASEIKRLKKEGATTYSLTPYINRFGEGSYVRAKKELKRLTGMT